MIGWSRPSLRERPLLLPDTRLSGPVPWMLAIMILMTVLAAAATLAIGNAVHRIGTNLERRITIQIMDANPDSREVQRQAAVRILRSSPEIAAVHEVGMAEMEKLLAPWLGKDAVDGDIPLPALIDAEIRDDAGIDSAGIAMRLRHDVPSARVDNNAAALAPVAELLAAIRAIAVMVMALMLVSIMAAIMLAVRGALNTHRAAIDVMHLMGATDAQLARQFQRRAALDALMGGAVGLLSAMLVLLLLRYRVAAMGSELAGSMGLGWRDFIVIVMIPLAAAGLATLVARFTVIRTLRKML